MPAIPAPLDLDALDALLAKATPGPWEQYDHDGPTNFKGTQAEYLASIHGEGWSSACTAFGILGPTPNFDQVAHLGALYHNGRVRVEEERANAALVVLLRNAAPALVSELRAAREALARSRPVDDAGNDVLADALLRISICHRCDPAQDSDSLDQILGEPDVRAACDAALVSSIRASERRTTLSRAATGTHDDACICGDCIERREEDRSAP